MHVPCQLITGALDSLVESQCDAHVGTVWGMSRI